jgi:hypothetical protein
MAEEAKTGRSGGKYIFLLGYIARCRDSREHHEKTESRGFAWQSRLMRDPSLLSSLAESAGGVQFANAQGIVATFQPNAFYLDPRANLHIVPVRFDFITYTLAP